VGSHDVLAKLLEIGVDIDARDSLSATALHMAASSGHKKAVELLINAGSGIKHFLGFVILLKQADVYFQM